MSVRRTLPVPAVTPRARASVKSVTHDNFPLAKVRAGLEEEGSPLVELRRGQTGEATGVRSASGSAEVLDLQVVKALGGE